VLLPQGALVAHIGDSRIYRLRGDALRQLTFDHSLVWEMKASGQLPEGVAASNVVPKNVITRSLGPNPKVKIDFEGPYPVQVGDVFLLCSDGLTGRVEDDELAMLMAHLEPRPAAGAMINLANLRGGPDNITVILVKVVGPHITTAAVQAEPLVLGAENDDKKTVHPALWVAMGVFFLSALVMGIASYAVAALAAGCLGVIAATVGVLQKFGSLKFFGSKEVTLSTGKRLGAGPYTETKIQAAAASPEAFQAWSDRTLHAVGHRARRVDLRPFQQQRDEIKSLLESQQPQRAMQLYADMLKTMIDQVRQEQRAQASDSSVEL
ncbi:MAG: serine/threonine-protein phosphatase, partial [Planctomycetales bacterium]|nr:serine/threonine-protein phosphatase [Planctomycetales bacterium]